tara:strand:- start:11241 stop:12527 length:1287 start_codon:yes stop_codon:yes gene_type:complete
MWDSLVVNQGETLPEILAHHPQIDVTIASSILKSTLNEPIEKTAPSITLQFPPTGEGWIKAYTGMNATQLVKQLKKQRRHNKDVKDDIDHLVNLIRTIKSEEVQVTLEGIDWATDRHDTLRSLGLTDRNLKSLRLFHNTRSSSLLRACEMWETSDMALKTLDEYQDVWGEPEQKAWVNAMETRKAARSVWRKSLHQIDSLTKDQKAWLELAKEELDDKGPMTSRSITANMVGVAPNGHGLTPAKMSKLLKMYGEEMDIIKGTRKGEYVLLKSDGLVLKNSDVWGYAAGFLDADGSIYITDRDEPRASFIATGNRGRVHCEQLHKVLDCGILQLDQKVYKNGQRSQHRVSFYSKDHLRKLLTGLAPHLRMKETQAKAVLAFIDEKDSTRKGQLRKLVQYLNWEGTQKGEDSLRQWGVDQDTVMGWAGDL